MQNNSRFFFGGAAIAFLLFFGGFSAAHAQFGTGFQFNTNNLNILQTDAIETTPLPTFTVPTTTTSTEAQLVDPLPQLNLNTQTNATSSDDMTEEEKKKMEEEQKREEEQKDIVQIQPKIITPIIQKPIDPVRPLDLNTKKNNDLPKKEEPGVIAEPVTEEQKKTAEKIVPKIENTRIKLDLDVNKKVGEKDDEESTKIDSIESKVRLPKVKIIDGPGALQAIDVDASPEDTDAFLDLVTDDGDDVGVSVGPSGRFKIEGDSLREWVEKATESSAVDDAQEKDTDAEKPTTKPTVFSPIQPASVKTGKDLNTYALDITARDEDVESVEIETDEVEVSYKKPARLFGIFPTKIKEEVRVKTDDDGNVDVDVKRPWWSIFTSEKDSTKKVQEDIEKRVDSTGAGTSSQESSVRLAGILGAIDRTMKIGSNKAAGIDVVSGLAEGLPDRDDVPEEGLVVSDLDVMMRQAFLGDLFNRPGSGSSAHIFIDLAIQGTFGDFASQQLSIAGRTAGDSGEFIVAGIGRVLALFDERGLSHQHDAFLRSALVLEVARAMNGDAAAAAFVNQYGSEVANILSNSGMPLTTSAGGSRTLVHFSICSGSNRAGCVDVATLLRSLGDPRSLSNLCDPGNMVLNGVINISGDERYGCTPPTGMCAASLTGGIRAGETAAPSLPGIQQPDNALGQPDAANGARDFLAEQGISGQDLESICGAHAAGALGLGGDTQQCIEEAISQIARQDLLGAAGMAGCMAGALGLELGADPAIDRVIDDALNSRGCGELADADEKKAPPADDKKPDDKKTEPPKEKDPPKKDTEPKKEEKGFFAKVGEAIAGFFGGGESKKKGPTVEPTYNGRGELVGIKAGGTKIEVDKGGVAVTLSGAGDHDNEIEAIISELDNISDGGGLTKIVDTDNISDMYQGALTALHRNNKGSSLEPGSGCSEALQALEAAYTQCSGEVINNAAAGAGVPGGSPAERLGRTAPGSNPFGGRPGEYGGNASVTDPITACMEANSSRTHGSGNWVANGGACGFMVCADGTNNCCQQTGFGNQAAGELLRDLRDCTEVMCVPGQPCLCAGEQDPQDMPNIPGPGGDGGGVNPLERR